MTIRTLPTSFPVFRLADFNSYKTNRATKVRYLAAACNWLWANMVRYYGFTGYEGHGNKLTYGVTDPSVNLLTDLPPDGSVTAKLLASFIVPPNWGPNGVLEMTGRSFLVQSSGTMVGKLVVAVYDLQDNYTGLVKAWTYAAGGNNDWKQEISIPQDKVYQLKVWIDPTLVSGTDSDALLSFCARYGEGSAANLLSGDTVPTTFQPVCFDYVDGTNWTNPPMTTALLRTLAKNLLHLYAYRPPQIIGGYFGDTHNNTNVFVEVGRYKVTLGPQCDTIRGRFDTFCTHGGAGNEVRVLVGGVVKETFAALAAGKSTQTWASIAGLTPGAEVIITVEAKSTAESGNWGTIVDGVFAWEYSQTITMPSGTATPANFVPIDEAGLGANKEVTRETMRELAANILWLAMNRTKTLVQDWRHRTYKRVGLDLTFADEYMPGDWTRGSGANYYLGQMKNITVMAQTTVADSHGNTDPNDRDGRGYFPYGNALVGWTTMTTWPAPADLAQETHGKRVGIVHYSPPALLAVPSGAQVKGWCRGKRCRPYNMAAFDQGTQGPLIEEEGFVNNGNLRLYSGSTMIGQWPIRGNANREDHESVWYGPEYVDASYWGTLNLRGNLTSSRAITNNLEGDLFEVELNGMCFVDVPYNQSMLNAL